MYRYSKKFENWKMRLLAFHICEACSWGSIVQAVLRAATRFVVGSVDAQSAALVERFRWTT
jgi:hypothetical protein